jgi:hypothetical protein
MPPRNQKEHYISQVLLRRFMSNKKLQKFDIKFGKWKRKGTSPKHIFSSLGYNQLIRFGECDNSLDTELGKLETKLPATIKALDDAANRDSTRLDAPVYENLCWYLAFLWNMCPFAKAVAPVNFIAQIMLDLQNGKIDRLKSLGHTESNIAEILNYHKKGFKFIITGKNFLQLVYRIVFSDKFIETHMQFRYATKWTIYKSPIELPISDIALIKFHDRNANAILHVLPIAPQTVLIGTAKVGTNIATSTDTIVKGGKLTDSEAEYIFDMICKSAFFTVASKSKLGDIMAHRKRATEKGITFPTIPNLERILTAGLIPFESAQDFLLTPASTEQYVKFTHSFIKPD